VEGEAGAGDQPGAVLPGQAFDAGGLVGDGEPDCGDVGRAGLPGPGGDGRVAERDAQAAAADVAAHVVADGGLPQLGQGGQGGVPADGVLGAGLALVPAQDVLPGLECLLSRPPAACDGDEECHGRRVPCGAQHR
jgi:hypothetical protein